jgi:DNA replication protein DnaC
MSEEPEPLDEILKRVKKKAEANKAESDERARQINEGYVQEQLEEWRRPRLAVIPKRYREATVEGEESQQWLAYALKGGTEGICFAGPTGTGKTWALWGLYRAFIDAQVNAVAINLIEFLDKLRPGGAEESVTLESLVRTPVLMMDDLGMHKTSEWTDEKVGLILNARYEWMRPTVFTTNFPPLMWKDVLGDRITSRLAEDCRIVEMRGKDRRLG